MKVLICGSTGLIGTHLTDFLSQNGHDVYRLVRTKDESPNSIHWIPSERYIDNIEYLNGFDLFINLSGENIVGRWTEKKKELIRSSRIETTSFLVDLMGKLKNPPECFISASAIGYYGDNGSKELTEQSESGEGFLEDLSVEWENTANRAFDLGVRVINLRIGVVLSKDGGALAQMLPVFRLGLGGVVGSGRQYWSWISIEDISRIIEYSANKKSIKGPINAVSPNPATCREFTKTLAGVLQRPAVIPVPSFLVKLVFGEMGEHALLASANVKPEKLLDSGYSFHHPELETALKELIQ